MWTCLFVCEIFTCDVCGQQFATQAAYRAHQVKMNLDTESKQLRKQEVAQHKTSEVAEHAHGGLPQCKYCKKKFSGWPALHYHINPQSCSEYREVVLGTVTISTQDANTP